MGSSLNYVGSLSGSFLHKVPYYMGDLNRDPKLENYRYIDASGDFQGEELCDNGG